MKHLTKLAVIMAVLFVANFAMAQPGMFHHKSEAEKKLHQKAVSLALIDYLKLSDAQKQEIKQILGQVRPDIEAHEAEMDKNYDNVVKPRLEHIIDSFEAGKQPNKASEQEQALFKNQRNKRRELNKKGKAAFKEILAVLTEEQKENLGTFDPSAFLGIKKGCDLRGLMRGDVDEILEKVRSAEDEDFKFMIDRMKERASNKQMRRGGKSKRMGKGGKNGMKGQRQGNAQNKEDRVNSLIDFLTKTREMSDSEFADSKGDLTKELQNLLPRKGKKGNKGNKAWKKGKRGHKMGPHGKKMHGRFMMHLVVFSDSFYDAL